MTPVNRWKLISFVLAGTITYSWWHGEAHSHTSVRAAQARLEARSGARAAVVATLSTDEIVQRLFAAKDIDDIRALAERLGLIGDDDAIDAVKPLLADARAGVPEAIVGVFGAIATDHAVDLLLEVARDPHRRDHRRAQALGQTHNRRGEPVIIELAQKYGDAAQTAAIDALANLGTERAVEVLTAIAGHPGDVATSAVRALAKIELPSTPAR